MRFLVFILIISWLFSGWPTILNFPPKIQKAFAVVANDVASESHTGTTGNTSAASFTWTHTPTGTPRGVLVFVFTISATKKVTGVTYGGVAMTDVSGGAAADTATEPGRVDTFFLGASIPTGAQSVVVSRTNDTTIMYATAATQTAGADTEVTGIVLLQENQAMVEQNVTDGSTGINSVRYAGAYSGLASPPGVGANSTLLVGIDLGAYGVNVVRETTAGQGSRPVGFSAATDDVAAVHLAVREKVVAPTVTTQAAGSVEATTATGNGTITATGGQNATAWGVCYKTSTGCTTADSTAAGSGTGGVGAFTASMTGLLSGTTYYIKAYATNSAGTSYGSEVTILTKPAAPTGVAATDGTYTDKVTITWTKSTGATNYHVWRDSTDLGAAGDVATFDDTGADAPTVTAGTANATDGSATDKVTLSISGASANNGTTYTYKVVASNATGNSADSTTNTGYRGVGSLTYQWYRSSGTGDSGYSTLSGATTAPYDDTTAPAPTITAGTADASDGTSQAHVALSVSGQSANVGAVRYYYATVSATGASSADTNHNDGYIGVGSLTYQWQRSAADSDASYSNIDGATTASYNDTGAPADGSGRYFKVVENATGATQQISTSDRGYRLAGSINADIVNASYVSVSSPTMAMNGVTFSLVCQTATGLFGTASQQIYVNNNNGANNGWTLTVAAQATTNVWDSVGTDYDFNDPTGSGCTDGADAGDSVGGQMTIDPSVATLAVGQCGSCTTNNISKGSSSAFNEGTTDTITLLTATAASDDVGDWILQGVSISQKIPAEQPAASDYDINIVLTVTAN